jgi:hypothetical protein
MRETREKFLVCLVYLVYLVDFVETTNMGQIVGAETRDELRESTKPDIVVTHRSLAG